MHLFRNTLDLGTRLKEAVDLLLAWDLLARVPGGVAATTAGRVASHARFDVLLVRQAASRVRGFDAATSHRVVALCTVDDYFGPAPEREKWRQAVEQWVDGVDSDKITLPKKFRGDFENGLEDLARVASLYGEMAAAFGLKEVARTCDQARAALLYGVAPEIVPLAALKFAGLGRRRCAALYHQYGIHGLDELAAASPELVRLPGLGPDRVREWVVRAAAIVARREADAARAADPEDAMDDLLAAFRVEPISLGREATA
jgi:Helix-hairpin-helix domain